ncbi:hypothetical protein [Sporosarcina phage Lietuvens]|nr:hypothetical protein [Sporosarcina phage Lietuvens]
MNEAVGEVISLMDEFKSKQKRKERGNLEAAYKAKFSGKPLNKYHKRALADFDAFVGEWVDGYRSN